MAGFTAVLRKMGHGISAFSQMESQRRQSGYESYKRGLNTKIHFAVDANGMPVRVLITEDTRADCKEEIHLIEGISAEMLLVRE